MEIIIIIFFSYLCGSIPFGLLLTKIFTGKDVRKIGSGNIGATNVLRSGNKYLAALTLILDGLKGFIPVLIAQTYFQEYVYVSALTAFLGHIFPVWLKFKGGKGVATYLGVVIAFSYGLGLLFVFTWITVSLIFKYSSVSSMFGAMTVFVVTLVRETVQLGVKTNNNFEDLDMHYILFIFFVLIIFTHQKNIHNLKNKKEKKIKI
jgi:acyl phosphate:glycerol-3-phosphate acyltransferase